MFTTTIEQPRGSLKPAIHSTVIHLSLIAGALWATKPVAVVVRRHNDPIDISMTVHHPRPICDCTVQTTPGSSTPVPTDVLTRIDIPQVDVPTGIHPVDPRSFIPGGSDSVCVLACADSFSTGAILEEAQVDEPPSLLTAGPLRYPTVLQSAGIGGAVTLAFVIDTEGRVEPDGLEVLSASQQAFVPAAEEAVRESRFTPARKGHTAVRVRVRQTITFRP